MVKSLQCELGVDKAAYQVRFDCLYRQLDEGIGEDEARETCQSEFEEELARLSQEAECPDGREW